ncbi:MAG: hypothetical protein ICV59_00495 [Thermoleophilia bacterium]|nr:hypothetical protein [Thermoleophilia bacterium]
MRRLFVVATAALVLGGAPAAAEQPRTDLVIRVWPKGKANTAVPRRWSLRCQPAGGTLPRRERACRRLKALRQPFAPVRAGVACTEVYGGPAVAEVRGRHLGRRVWARFTRTDGCQIARWNRLRFLFVVR